MKKLFIVIFAFFFVTNAYSADAQIEMLNKRDDGARMVYSKEVVKIDTGQSIEWVAKDKGHNVEMVAGPDGSTLPKKSKLSKNFTMTFDKPGIYIYKCTPHVGLGMIGIVVVGGNSSNKDAISKVKFSGKAKKKRDKLLSEM